MSPYTAFGRKQRHSEHCRAAVLPSDDDLVARLQNVQVAEDPRVPVPAHVACDDRRTQLAGGRRTGYQPAGKASGGTSSVPLSCKPSPMSSESTSIAAIFTRTGVDLVSGAIVTVGRRHCGRRSADSRRHRRSPGARDRFDAPLYTIAEAARYLHVPASTMAAWTHGDRRRVLGRNDVAGQPVLTAVPKPGTRSPVIPSSRHRSRRGTRTHHHAEPLQRIERLTGPTGPDAMSGQPVVTALTPLRRSAIRTARVEEGSQPLSCRVEDAAA